MVEEFLEEREILEALEDTTGRGLTDLTELLEATVTGLTEETLRTGLKEPLVTELEKAASG